LQRVELEVNVREGCGKAAARRVRTQGGVPAILYGSGLEPVPLAIDRLSLERALRTGANTLIDLKGLKDFKGKLVLIKEVQRDPVSQRLIHCDVYAVDAKKKLHISVPVYFVGKPSGVEKQGGILETLALEVEVTCLPFSIPDRISVDVSDLEIGDTVHLRDLTLPEGVEAVTDESLALAHVSAPRVEEVEAAPEAPAEEAAEAPTEEEPGADTAGE
jgi:large subunit ribosomal protein L25